MEFDDEARQAQVLYYSTQVSKGFRIEDGLKHAEKLLNSDFDMILNEDIQRESFVNYEDPPATAGAGTIPQSPHQLLPFIPPSSALPALARPNRLLT